MTEPANPASTIAANALTHADQPQVADSIEAAYSAFQSEITAMWNADALPGAAVTYECGCAAGGDNIATFCPQHGSPIDPDFAAATQDAKALIAHLDEKVEAAGGKASEQGDLELPTPQFMADLMVDCYCAVKRFEAFANKFGAAIVNGASAQTGAYELRKAMERFKEQWALWRKAIASDELAEARKEIERLKSAREADDEATGDLLSRICNAFDNWTSDDHCLDGVEDCTVDEIEAAICGNIAFLVKDWRAARRLLDDPGNDEPITIECLAEGWKRRAMKAESQLTAVQQQIADASMREKEANTKLLYREERISELEQQITELTAQQKQSAADWADDHDHLQKLCRTAGIPKDCVEGDSYGVPGIQDLGDMLVGRIAVLTEREAATRQHNDWFYRECLYALAGAVCTPEEGFEKSGGLGSVLQCVRDLRAEYNELTERLAAAEKAKGEAERGARAWASLMDAIQAVSALDDVSPEDLDAKLNSYVSAWSKQKQAREAAEARVKELESQLAERAVIRGGVGVTLPEEGQYAIGSSICGKILWWGIREALDRKTTGDDNCYVRLPSIAPSDPGPQPGPASVGQIEAQVKQVKRELGGGE